ncbi:MAG: alcohol dehydrogenase catalytic domain-containing protein [Chloroflexi bacterium]|nr:alcohol dehydrogenase catalytic domain-containing protein [Chloroflexota bacterium]
MKAAIFYGGKDIRVEDVPMPEPGAGEVQIKIMSAGVCGSDLHPYRGHNPYGVREPHQRGHELAGEITALGDGVRALAIGQRVGIEAEHLLGCGSCRNCKDGQYHVCPARGLRHGERQESHGFSQYDVCVAANCHPLPDGVDFDAASQVDCYACGVHALNRCDVAPGDTAVVLGTGAIGITLGQVAKAFGVRRVIMVGTRDEPLQIAMEANAADEVIVNSRIDPVEAVLEATGGQGADLVFETVGGSAPTISQAIGMARYGGTVSILGVFTEDQSVDVATAYRKELQLRWSNSYSSWRGVSEYETALELLADGRVNPKKFINKHFALGKISEAFAAADDKRSSGAIKVMVHPNAG